MKSSIRIFLLLFIFVIVNSNFVISEGDDEQVEFNVKIREAWNRIPALSYKFLISKKWADGELLELRIKLTQSGQVKFFFHTTY
jgi:hypothetical protein